MDRNPKITKVGGASLVGLPTWFWVTNPAATGAPTGTRSVRAQARNVWAQVNATSTGVTITTAAGFTTAEVVKDKSGEHDLFLHGPNKSVLYFGTAKRTSLYLRSGCHRLPGKPIDPDHPQNT